MNSTRKKQLYLVDVSSFYFRAFYAIRSLTSPSGLPVNAIYGFLSMAVKLLKDIHPDGLVFCFDRPEPSFRKELDQRYKANRSEMPDDLVPQVPWFRKLSEAMGVKCLDAVGFEADDVIGTLARWGQDQGMEIVIVSSDKDFAQLVNSNVTMFDTMKDIRIGPDEVLEKFGVQPQQMIDYLAIVGDSSDNVPGVQGLGPKGAQKLLHEFGSLKNVYEQIDRVKPDGARKKLELSRTDAFLSQKLVTIRQDVPFDLRPEDVQLKPIDRPGLREMLLELGFKTFSRQLLGEESVSTPLSTNGSLADTSEVASKVPARGFEVSAGERLKPGPFFLETEMDAQALGEILEETSAESELDSSKSIWVDLNERGLWITLTGRGQVMRVTGDWTQLVEPLSRLKLSGHDLKRIATELRLRTFRPEWDSMLAAYVLRPGENETLSALYIRYLGTPIPELASGSQSMGWQLALRREMVHRLEVSDAQHILDQEEIPIAPILYRMQSLGIRIDRQQLQEMSIELGRDIERLEKEIQRQAGEQFAVGSPKQLGQILFGKLGLPTSKKTKTGYSTDNDVLEGLKSKHPIAAYVIDWRELSKLKSTYVDALLGWADSHDRIHTTFNQALTATGRLSSTNPNLQNLPIRTERGARIRRAFVAPESKLLLSADYSQIELRILAQITQDRGLVRAFEQGQDIHAATASEIFDIPLSSVTDEMRRKAKAVNFGLAYGQGAFGLAETLGISRTEAKSIVDRYFARFPGVADYMSSIVEKAKAQGYVETLFGRRRWLPELKSSRPMERKFGERAAINAPIQGTASDIVKRAMIGVDRWIGTTFGTPEEHPLSQRPVELLLQVHDELVFEISANEGDRASSEIKSIMEKCAGDKFTIPLIVNTSLDRTL